MSTSIENDTKQSSCMLNFMYSEHENLLKVAICFYTSKIVFKIAQLIECQQCKTHCSKLEILSNNIVKP